MIELYDALYRWAENNFWFAVLLPFMFWLGVCLWNWFVDKLVEKVANDFGLLVMWMLESLPPRWDKWVLDTVKLMEKEIPDNLTVTPAIREWSFKITKKVPALGGNEEKIAMLLVRLLLSLDVKAKEILKSKKGSK